MAYAAGVESGSKEIPYCRKQKSLGLLCSNFLSLYNREGIETIGLDDAASRLGIVSDIVCSFISFLGYILARKAKNRYTWKGFGAIPKALEDLKKGGLRENGPAADTSCSEKVSDDDEDEMCSDMNSLSQNDKSDSTSAPKSAVPSKSGENRKEKSLGLLTQNFVKLFLCTDMDMISLDDAAKLLLGDGKHTSMTTRTKVRRLYDIANVLSSMKFIEKTHHPETRKPAFRCGKRFKVGEDAAQVLKPHNPMRVKHETENEVERTRSAVKSYQFGPFAPANVPKSGASQDERGKQVVDWESLASAYRPQYHNQGNQDASETDRKYILKPAGFLSAYPQQHPSPDPQIPQSLKDLFSHYVEAWKSWYSEVAGKPNTANVLNLSISSTYLSDQELIIAALRMHIGIPDPFYLDSMYINRRSFNMLSSIAAVSFDHFGALSGRWSSVYNMFYLNHEHNAQPPTRQSKFFAYQNMKSSAWLISLCA
ncbi:UNVERIFIED_CONTAM: E2F transcription factor-like E2FE [Sesamum calycinum]|uniref:E2F transcription factor-like E2FE n=1 Tax=Sesamum calycinum TaxID=2727403 RepID=A0AAW2NFJ2_9LAMI